ncbi:hypothetical protein [Scytonema sp. PCC 10023]|uniref:hypothetical protein n=1 Tax=Scytonema sp. PCC 10023 TaxID=1680591 RepID=UPI0039C6BFE0
MPEHKERKSPLIVIGVVSAALSIGTAFDKNLHPGIKTAIPLVGFASCLIARHGVRHELTELEEKFAERWDGLDHWEKEIIDREQNHAIALKKLEQEKRTLHNEHVAKLNNLREAENRYREQYENRAAELQSEYDALLAELNKDKRIHEKEKELQEALLAAKKDQIATQLHEQHLERQSEVDNREALLNQRIRDVNSQLEALQQQIADEYQEKLAAFEDEKNSILDRHAREIDSWRQRYQDAQKQIAISKAPKFPIGGDEIAGSECIKVIQFLWRLEKPIKVDCHERQPQNQGDQDVFWLLLRDATQLADLKSKASEIQYLLGKGHKPVIEQEKGEASIRFELKRNTSPGIVLKASKQDVEDKIPTLAKYKNGDRGWLVTGHPGAGKTSVLIWLGQILGGDDCDRIALNPHNDEKSTFELYGYHEITSLTEIYQQFELLAEELNLRGGDSTRRRKLIIAVDELGKILSNAEDPTRIMEIIRQINVEGRKLGMVILVGNHSQTTTAVKMDAEYRSAFYQLFLVGASRELLRKPNAPEFQDWEYKWIQDTAYPAITLINGQWSLCLHPTHWDYSEYRDKGNPPKGLKKTSTSKLSIKLAGIGQVEPNQGLSSEEIEVINKFKKLPVSEIIYKTWGLKQSRSPQYKARKAQVLEFLAKTTHNP